MVDIIIITLKCPECLSELKKVINDIDPLSENLIIKTEIINGYIHYYFTKEYDMESVNE